MKRPLPDTQPSWRDPDLRVFYGEDAPDGVDPKELSAVCKDNIERNWDDHHPRYKDDPTYNLRRKK